MPTTDAQKRATAKYGKENYQYISFKARIGSRDRIIEAANAKKQSVNGFIKTALSNAINEAIGKTLEPTNDEFEFIKAMRLRKITDESYSIASSSLETTNKIFTDINNALNIPLLSEAFSETSESDLSSIDKSKDDE